ncbi:MAG: sugar ABC transporter ATP-binding protein [Eubacteriales bacterium]
MKIDYNNNTPIIQMCDIVKEFSGVRALSGITFDVYQGEIHCIVGENGAGKSTLMKILSGAYTPTSGSIKIDHQQYTSLSPALSKELGINIVYQENDLVPVMNAVENVFVGNEKTKYPGLIDFKAMLKSFKKIMETYKIIIDPLQTIENMSVSDQQFVKIIKALSNEPRILIMDEPTSMFNAEDADKVLNLVRNIAEKGISIIFISHFLKEVVQIADRITVIRDGSVIRTYSNENRNVSFNDITRDMVGRPIEMFYKKETHSIGEIMFEVKNLKIGRNSPSLDFHIRKGEILGFSGMVGSGRTEIVRAVSGADHRFSGDIYLNGKKLKINNPGDSISAGIAHITEDRQRLGLNLTSSVLENILIVGLDKIKSGLFYNYRKHTNEVQTIADDLNIKASSMFQEVMYLSGGNQQKVVLGKWIYSDQTVYIFDEPTRGIDVNAKAEFYKKMTDITKQGNCILMVSSDMPELISMSDRVLVVRDGSIVCELSGEDLNEQTIIKQALGVKKNVDENDG